jgi:hypothetical protein
MAENYLTINIKGNNQKIIILTKNLIFFDRSKYIIIYYYNIRDLQKRNRVEV